MAERSKEALTYWWEQVPGENVFMEISREDIETDLKAPSAEPMGARPPLSNVNVARAEDGTITATGGVRHLHAP
ncbi:MAG: hypothetical protein ACXVBG_23370 [Isosphaeraceae bacterium]